MEETRVILVNREDEETGFLDKMEAHRTGVLHRAFSILIFNHAGEMLIHQRAAGKYHSPLLWTNACCSHPHPGEKTLEAAKRRLKEELGISCELRHLYSFIYKHSFSNGLKEHEFDHVIIGNYDAEIFPDKTEVAEWKYISVSDLKAEVAIHPDRFSVWFRIILNNYETYLD